ncbi:hypothetical protein LK996_05035 [Lysobacter sp. A6]|uniref:Tetratricopeptide repeat protein n=1 Tax=Noviluteimonas lactosilytica TaxID=2888523 RepID=A0ABS8JFP9_9GAMM|nr:hypothetical protein [Lysobacter lactosilyticus]MCC8362436.1 hypothetical protein [Lysobacter lactosilyticus]
MLYSFYWEKIDAAAADVLAADPDCAMAYWALAVASLANPLGSPPSAKQEAHGWEMVQKAKRLGAKTERERDWIDAIAVVFEDYDTVPFKQRAQAYTDALARLRARWPDDSEAAIQYAFWLQVTADRNDQTYARQLESAKLLEPLFATNPNHPGIAHFLIHAYDFPAIADRGLDAARRYASIAPDSPHALHMPSHIFSRAGQWQESIATNQRSRAAATRDPDVFHAIDYMAYADLQLARDEDVRALVAFVESATPKDQVRQVAYASASVPARYALERHDWAAASKLALHPLPETFDWKQFPEAEAVNAFARGIGAARLGETAAAKSEVARLEALRTRMVEQDKGYWVEQADLQAGAIRAWIARAEKHDDEALALMRETADREDRTEEHIMMPGRVIPAREMLGEMLLELDRPADALAAFETSLRNDPNRFRNLLGAARAAERAGDRAKARTYYTRLLAQVGDADGRSEIAAARAFVQRDARE